LVVNTQDIPVRGGCEKEEEEEEEERAVVLKKR
jgi:hypothetical protein